MAAVSARRFVAIGAVLAKEPRLFLAAAARLRRSSSYKTSASRVSSDERTPVTSVVFAGTLLWQPGTTLCPPLHHATPFLWNARSFFRAQWQPVEHFHRQTIRIHLMECRSQHEMRASAMTGLRFYAFHRQTDFEMAFQNGICIRHYIANFVKFVFTTDRSQAFFSSSGYTSRVRVFQKENERDGI
jgi:hypothetical protein